MLYYYLDGLEKRGPYTFDELKSRNLEPDTLVFTEGMENWLPLKEINGYSLPLQKKLSSNNNVEQESEKTNNPVVKADSINTKTSNESKIKIPVVLILFVFFAMSIGASYLLVKSQKEHDYIEVNKKLDEFFKGKNAVADYTYQQAEGKLYKVIIDTNYDSFFPGIGINKRMEINGKMDNTFYLLAIKPASNDKPFEKQNSYEKQQELQKWNLYSELKDYYVSDTMSGFNILKLERLSPSHFILREMWSEDMAYKVPESIYHAGTNFGYGYSTPGYNAPTNRPSISMCYENAAKFLMAQNSDNSYEAGSYYKINEFRYLKSKYYEVNHFGVKMTHRYHRAYRESIDNQGKSNESETYYMGGSPYISYSQFVVWYTDLVANEYYVEDQKSVFIKYWIIYSAIGMLIVSLIYFGIRYRKRIVFH